MGGGRTEYLSWLGSVLTGEVVLINENRQLVHAPCLCGESVWYRWEFGVGFWAVVVYSLSVRFIQGLET
jgi:glucose dehydrogenase